MSKILQITWLDACNKCGFNDNAEVTIEQDRSYLWTGDSVKCPNCNHTGVIECKDGLTWVNWDEVI